MLRGLWRVGCLSCHSAVHHSTLDHIDKARQPQLEIGIDRTWTKHTELEPYFWAKWTEPTQHDQLTKPNCQAIWTEPNFVVRDNSHGSEEFPNLNYDTSPHKTRDVFVCVFYFSILIVKDQQTVEPNAKYTCTAKRFYVTDILKPNQTQTTVSIESNWSWTKLQSDQTEPKPWPWPNRTFVSGFDSHHKPQHCMTLVWRPFSRTTLVSQYQNVSILDVIGAKDEWGSGDNWSSCKTCNAPVK